MRGSHPQAIRVIRHLGSTPAYAGIPTPTSAMPSPARVYPRVCGDPPATPAALELIRGLPPRMRGSRTRMSAAYPSSGLPPRMRGSHVDVPAAAGDVGSTPAYAGIPSSHRRRRNVASVYPRVCGDPAGPGAPPPASTGLPPRMRGSPQPSVRRVPGQRSTPAYAGIPLPHNHNTIKQLPIPEKCYGVYSGKNTPSRSRPKRVQTNRIPRRGRPHAFAPPYTLTPRLRRRPSVDAGSRARSVISAPLSVRSSTSPSR